MKSVVELWVTCLKEAGDQHHVRVTRDIAYAMSRIEHEGIAFLTITLPGYEKSLLEALSTGRADSNLFAGSRRAGGLPRFLSGFLRQVFDASGLLRPNAEPSVIRSLRQVLLLCSKLELPVTPDRMRRALRAYVETDQNLVDVDAERLRTFSVVSRRLLGPLLSAVELRLFSGDWAPRHSSGATADRLAYNQRHQQLTWTDRLNEVFPYWDDLLSNAHEIVDNADQVTVLARDSEPPVRVTAVPKTMKGPRIIAMEPSWMMFVQQGIFHVMTEELHSGRHTPLVEAFSWLDQTPNRAYARDGSVDGSSATLDLSEASDRVSLQIVEALLASTPFLRRCVLACRSTKASVPLIGETVELRKFASMGSALCFPVESMVFYIISAIAAARSCGIAPEKLRVRDLPRIRVYGDDLIVPYSVARSLVQELEAYGLKVNARKSFTTGHFRESCGADWFKGADVSVFKLRHALPERRHQYAAIDQAIAFHNNAYSAGWFRVAAEVERQLRLVLPSVPRAPVGSRVTALWSWTGPFAERMSPTLQRLERRSVEFRQIKPPDPLDGWGAFKKVHYPHGQPLEKSHLERDGRSRYVGVNIGWRVEPF